MTERTEVWTPYHEFRARTDPRPWGLEHACGCDWETVEDGSVQRKRFFHAPDCPAATTPTSDDPGRTPKAGA